MALGFFALSRDLAERTFSVLGEPATLVRKSGQSIETRAVIRFAPVNGDVSTQLGTVIELKRAEVPEIGHGDRINLQGRVWRVESQIDSDDDVLRLRVREDRS